MCLPRGCLPGDGDVCPWVGVSAQGVGCLPGDKGCLQMGCLSVGGGFCPGGCLPGGKGCLLGGGVYQTPPL